MSNNLTLEDISDLRQYEREREEFRPRVIEMKKRRRIHVGPIMTFVFENKDTMRLQIQEMARVEKIMSDEKIQEEINIYNDLIPNEFELKATLLIELVTDEELRKWLPALRGIQNHIALKSSDIEIKAVEIEEERLSREDDITSTVHYLTFTFTPDQKQSFINSSSSWFISIDHPEYVHETKLSNENLDELKGDLANA